MPEYLAPGVYVEEVSFRSKSIEGVSTTTTGFIGPTRYGPLELEPELITSLGEFERIYGDGQRLVFVNNDGDDLPPIDNYVWHAARAFFEEGGKRLYVVRAFRAPLDDDGVPLEDYGFAQKILGAGDDAITVRARFPGCAGSRRVRITANLGQNVLTSVPDPDRPGVPGAVKTVARGLRENDIVVFTDAGVPFDSPLSSPLDSPRRDFRRVRSGRRPDTNEETWFFDTAAEVSSPLSALDPNSLDLRDLRPEEGDQIQVVTLTVTVFPTDPFELSSVWTDLPLDPNHAETGTNRPDSLFDVFAKEPPNRAMAYRLPIVIKAGDDLGGGLAVLETLYDASITARDPIQDPELIGVGIFDALNLAEPTDSARSFDIVLDGGSDGLRPGMTEYEGEANPTLTYKTGFKALEDLEDISIVAAPGSTFRYDDKDYRADARAITNLLISHAERMKYRIAVVDSGDGQSLSQVRAFKAQLDSKYAAFYYPWVRVLDPITRREIHLPPSGFVAGIYARNDIERAVFKAPANEVVRLAIGFETLLNKSQQDVLNPEGINAFRFFEGRGNRLWGARTTSSDPEWKYVNLRRYFAYLEHSIDRGTQWAVFEPNGELLWAGVRRTVEDFLLNEWQAGALLGDKPEKAFFVRCDRSTMTQNDLDNGRLVCLIGVVALRPAEFVIFRIGQATADSMRRP
jgi:phage tail sheath protein FI